MAAAILISLTAIVLSLIVHKRKPWRADAYPLGDVPRVPSELVASKNSGGWSKPATKGTHTQGTTFTHSDRVTSR